MNVQIGPADRIAPGPIQTPAVSAFANHVDFQWPAVPDDANGTGIVEYSWYRNFQWMTNTTALTWSDTTVQPGTEYIYSFQAIDRHWNINTTTLTVTTPGAPTGSPNPPDGRQVGHRPTGAYWGAGSEQIDVLSGNLNYTLPLLNAVNRITSSVSFNLTYNSQNWRQDSGGLWNLGADVGYGYGWKLLAGALTPIYSGATLSYYNFTDATGAQYRLDVNTSGIWSSRESVYVEYDSSSNRLYFRNGSFWVMGCTSASGEPDQGTMYPTLMQETNGNQITISYLFNNSARISAIYDVRAGYYTFSYSYDAAATPHYHLASITNSNGTAEKYTFTYGNQTLQAPFSPYTSYGTTKILGTVSVTGLGMQTSFTYDGDNSAGLSYVYLGYGGYLHWTYGNVTYTGGITYREVQSRYLSKDGTSSTLYGFSHEATPGTIHQYTIIDDPGGVGEKYWSFSQTGANTGMVGQFQGRQRPGPVTKAQNDITWTQDATGNLYIRSVLETLDPGQSYQVQKKTDQNVDIHGNVTDVFQYDYNSLTVPARIYSLKYLNTSAYTALHIYDRLTQATFSSGPSNNTILATNSYDTGGWGSNFTGPPRWDTSYTTVTARGNLTRSVTPRGTLTWSYNMIGDLVSATGTNGVSTTITPDSSHAYAVPSQITTGTVTETMTWNTALAKTGQTGSNTDSTSTVYDVYGRHNRQARARDPWKRARRSKRQLDL